MKHINQDCGSSCGPASLKMIMAAAGYRDDLSIQDIFAIAPTKIGGTPWPRMSGIMRKLGIKHSITASTPLSYFKHQPANKAWMLAVYYGNIKHWIVLKEFKNGMFHVLDPADTEKQYSEQELTRIFVPRNSLAIEFDLEDLLGETPAYDTRDADGGYVMDIVDQNQMRLYDDSNFIFGKKGRKCELSEIESEEPIDEDYIYCLTEEDLPGKENLFAYSIDKPLYIYIRYK